MSRSKTGTSYFRCLLTSFVIANMFTLALPPNTAFSLSSALIWRRFFLSWSPFFLMYAQSFFVTSARCIAFAPTMGASVSLGVTGLMKAAFGLRAVFFFAVFFAMRSPMKTHNASRESTTKMTTFPLGNPSNSPHDGASRPQDPLQDALRDERRHPLAGARHRGQH